MLEKTVERQNQELSEKASRNYAKSMAIYYDLKKSPGKYVECTRKICKAMGEECNINFLPSRRSWVPCHVKFDTESVLEMFTPCKRRMDWRRSFDQA